MDKTTLLQHISELSIWKRGDERAPHKPLLILLYLGRLQANQPRMIMFSEVEPKLTRLLREFGPSRTSYHPEEPFCRLRNDNIWELSTEQWCIRPQKTALREHQVSGGFLPEIFELLQQDQDLVDRIASALLYEHFPETLHQDILGEVGLDIDFALDGKTKQQKRRARNPEFRQRILQAYDYRCAICNFEVWLGKGSERSPVALETAHIKWFQSGGPDVENNGLALCSMHHKLLDTGAIGISQDNTILVSDKVGGHGGFQEWVMNFDGKPLRKPRQTVYTPKIEFTEWHIREVFKGKYGHSQ